MTRPGVTVTRPPAACEAPLASLLVLAGGLPDVTEVCLRSIEASLGDRLGREYELVLVDNGSTDGIARLFDAWRDRATVVTIDHNAKYARGNNIGATAARGEVLVLMNNDMEVKAGSLEAVVETARRPGVGVVGLRLLYPDGALQHGGAAFFSVRGGPPIPYHLFHHQAGDLPYTACELELDVVTAACMALPRSVFEELGGFDERFINGWEDTDLCLRARVAGHRVIYRGDVTMIHHEGLTVGRAMTEQGMRNMQAFLERWIAVLEPDGELMADLFDAEFVPPTTSPEDGSDGVPLSIEGQLTGLAPEADEARALLGAFEAAGWSPAARDVPYAFLGPRLDPDERVLVERARGRVRVPGALAVHVPVGARAPCAPVLRLAGVPSNRLAEIGVVWAASPHAVDALVEAGVPADRVSYVPPAIAEQPLGPGGDGVLALLPAHDLAAARRALTEHTPQRIIPSATSAPLADLVAELAPGAQLLVPCSSERRFAALAATADTVVCADASDRFQRRALIAAATGAAVVTFEPGAATAVLADLPADATREQRAAAVRARCAPEVVVACALATLGQGAAGKAA